MKDAKHHDPETGIITNPDGSKAHDLVHREKTITEKVDEFFHDPVEHPKHYAFGKFEVWDCIVAWGLNYCKGCAVKYIARSGRKENELEDLFDKDW